MYNLYPRNPIYVLTSKFIDTLKAFINHPLNGIHFQKKKYFYNGVVCSYTLWACSWKG